MTVEAAVPEAAPVMIAWKAYQAGEEYANSFKWAAHEERRKGSMWAAFYAGFYASALNNAEQAGDLVEALADCLAELSPLMGAYRAEHQEAICGKAREAILRADPNFYERA